LVVAEAAGAPLSVCEGGVFSRGLLSNLCEPCVLYVSALASSVSSELRLLVYMPLPQTSKSASTGSISGTNQSSNFRCTG
jgi:hypothetical protein